MPVSSTLTDCWSCPPCCPSLPCSTSCRVPQFCKQCAVEHAGLRRALGTFSNLCSYVSPAVVCPQCRQPAVYREAVRMRQLDRVLKARWVPPSLLCVPCSFCFFLQQYIIAAPAPARYDCRRTLQQPHNLNPSLPPHLQPLPAADTLVNGLSGVWRSGRESGHLWRRRRGPRPPPPAAGCTPSVPETPWWQFKRFRGAHVVGHLHNLRCSPGMPMPSGGLAICTTQLYFGCLRAPPGSCFCHFSICSTNLANHRSARQTHM